MKQWVCAFNLHADYMPFHTHTITEDKNQIFLPLESRFKMDNKILKKGFIKLNYEMHPNLGCIGEWLF